MCLRGKVCCLTVKSHPFGFMAILSTPQAWAGEDAAEAAEDTGAVDTEAGEEATEVSVIFHDCAHDVHKLYLMCLTHTTTCFMRTCRRWIRRRGIWRP